MPGNAGGAKGPDFWCAFEDGEVVVIGDEPANTSNEQEAAGDCCVEGRRRVQPTVPKPRAVSLSPCALR